VDAGRLVNIHQDRGSVGGACVQIVAELALGVATNAAITQPPQNNGLELTSASANGLQRSQLNPVLDGRQ
jgi:hypothetical protein